MMNASGAMESRGENWDAIKRLYRGASDLVRTLDKVVKNAASIQDLYNLRALNLRTRLRDACERLIFLDPTGHGKKAEDLLWRKVHYEVIAAAKNFRKNPAWSTSDQFWVTQHVKLGIGMYHHLLFRLQSEYDISVEGCADILLCCDLRGSVKDKHSKSHGASAKVVMDEEVSVWALQCYQRCLICMGDLTRYLQELCNGSAQSAARYYHQALLVGTKSSMPHNQLGTLAGSKNYNCDAAFYYMRCVMSSNGFDGAKGNLRRVFDKNQLFLQDFTMQELRDTTNLQNLQIKKFLVSFLHYCEACFKYPDVDTDLPIQHLCQMLMEDFQKCLCISLDLAEGGSPLEAALVPDSKASDVKQSTSNSAEQYCRWTDHVCDDEAPCHLPHNLIFKVFVMALMCIEKLGKEGSVNESAATALSLAAFSELLNFVLLFFKKRYAEHVHFNDSAVPSQVGLERSENRNQSWDSSCVPLAADGYPNSSVVDVKSKLRKKASRTTGKLRHRRKLRDHADRDDSDLSDAEEVNSGSDTAPSRQHGVASEDEHTSDDDDKSESSRASDDECAEPIDSCYSLEQEGPASAESFDWESVKQMNIDELFSDDKLLAIVKICSDWLRVNPQIISASAQGSQKLWSRYVELLNMLIKLKEKLNTSDMSSELLERVARASDEKWTQLWPLPEDVALNDFQLLSDAHQDLDMSLRSTIWLTGTEETVLRIASLQHMGMELVGYAELGVSCDAKTGLFSLNTVTSSATEDADQTPVTRKGKSWAKHNSELKMQDHKRNLMHNMAQLWLEAEVKELETVVHKTAKPMFSPYLVPDSYVLVDHLHIIRQLMSSKIFIFILPIAVLQHLDEKKKESIKAREAIRWLEGEFQKRNRYLRAQKPHERLPLALLKYPKRKDKDAWNMFAILECSNYFAHQGSAANELSPNLVTMLTASSSTSQNGASEKPNGNLHVVAKTAGLLAERIEELYSSWTEACKTPTKGGKHFSSKAAKTASLKNAT